jgi:hypothetical protein
VSSAEVLWARQDESENCIYWRRKQKASDIYKRNVAGAFSPMGLGLRKKVIPHDINSYYLDWYDTVEGNHPAISTLFLVNGGNIQTNYSF